MWTVEEENYARLLADPTSLLGKAFAAVVARSNFFDGLLGQLQDPSSDIYKAVSGIIGVGPGTGGGTVATGYDGLPPGTTITVNKTGSTWPARPTPRTDITVAWRGADPSPAIVSSGTGGMLDNVDYRLVTP